MRARKFSIAFAAFAAWYNIGCFAPYLPLFVNETLGATSLIVGLVTMVYWLVNTPASTLHGYLVDKSGKPRTILTLSMIAHSLLNSLYLLIDSVDILFLVRAVQGFTYAPMIPLTNLLAAYEFGVSRGVGIAGSIGAAGFLAGSISGSAISSLTGGYRWVFVSAGIIMALSSTLLMFSIRGSPESKVETSRFRLEYVKSIPLTVWIVYLGMFLRQVGATGIWALFPLYLRSIGADDFIIATAFAINTASQTILMSLAAKLSEKGALRVFLGGLVLSSIVFLGYSMASWWGEVLPLQLILGGSWSALSVSSNIHIIRRVRGEIRATALGLLTTFQGLSWIIGSSINGFVSEYMGSLKVYPAFASMLTLIAAGIVLITLLISRGE